MIIYNKKVFQSLLGYHWNMLLKAVNFKLQRKRVQLIKRVNNIPGTQDLKISQ